MQQLQQCTSLQTAAECSSEACYWGSSRQLADVQPADWMGPRHTAAGMYAKVSQL